MPIAHVGPELALAVGAVAVVLVAIVVPRERHGWCAGISLVALGVAAVLAVQLHRTVPPTLTFSGTWALDGLTTWGTYAILGTAGVTVLLSPPWFHGDRRHGEWYAILLFSTLGAVLLAGAADLAQLVVAVLLSSVTGYTLASYHRRSRMAAEAGAKFFLLGALANPIMFLGAVFLYGLAGTTGYAGLQNAFATGSTDPLVLSAGVALVAIGLLFELGAVPVHPWVPDVAQGSPAPAAAFLTVAPKIGALVALARFLDVVPHDTVAWRPAMAGIAVLTMTLGNLAALWQDDVRRLLGWSTVSQAGYGLMAVVALGVSDLALPSLVLFAVGYSAANLAAFSVVVALRGRTAIADYAGLFRERPALAVALTLALLSLTGFPPLVGFATKLALFGATIEAAYGWLAFAAVVNTVVSLFYYLRVIAPMVLSHPTGRVAVLGGASGFAVAAATTLVVMLGLAAQVVLDGSTGVALLP